MRTCYLHLGMPKTGSSSIQGAFAGFETADLAYAKTRGSNHGPGLCFMFSRQPQALPEARWRKLRPLRDKLPFADFGRQFRKEMSSPKSVIFSGEIMVDRLDAVEFATMVGTLKSSFDRVVAIAYIRPLASLAASQFQQRVKTGLRRFVIPAPDYRKRFEKVLNEFAPGDRIWRRFDRADLAEGDIVADFAQVLGVPKPPAAGLSKNESLSAEAMGALYAFNRFTAPLLRPAAQDRLRTRLLEDLREVGETRFGLSTDLLARHLERHAEDVAWMEEVCGFDVKGRISPVPEPVSSETDLLDLAARIGDSPRGAARKAAS